jgi:hypothetical protein
VVTQNKQEEEAADEVHGGSMNREFAAMILERKGYLILETRDFFHSRPLTWPPVKDIIVIGFESSWLSLPFRNFVVPPDLVLVLYLLCPCCLGWFETDLGPAQLLASPYD